MPGLSCTSSPAHGERGNVSLAAKHVNTRPSTCTQFMKLEGKATVGVVPGEVPEVHVTPPRQSAEKTRGGRLTHWKRVTREGSRDQNRALRDTCF